MVKKKQAYFKNLRRTILKSKARILAIFAIVILGAAFFAGLRNTPEIMMLSIDRYLDNYHFSDLIYLTNLGLSEDDIKCIEEIEGIDKIQYGYQFDALFVAENKLKGVTVYTNESYHEDMLNYPDLLEGEFPTQSYECLVDNIFAQDNNLKVGNVIKIKNDQGEKSFKITGLINDVRFLSDMDRGTNTLGDGSNDGFIEILTKDNEFLALPKEIYDLRDEEVLYNQLLVSVEGAKGYNLFSSDYDDYIESLNTKIKSQLSLRMSHLYDDITSDAREQLDKAEKEYEDGLRTYNESKDVFDSKILDAKIQLATAKLELAEAKKQYLDASKTATSGMKVLPEEIEKLQKQIDELTVYKEKQDEFEIEKEKYYEEVVFSDNAPDIKEYKTYYESIDPANAEVLYKQVVEQTAKDEKLANYVSTYSSMKPQQAADIFNTMTDNLDLVADILEAMETEARANILGKMDKDTAAKITQMLKP